MRRICLLIAMCICSTLFYAQNEIQFSILTASKTGVSEDVVRALDVKMKQILTRNSAAAANQYTVFAIEPVIEIGETLASEGLMQEVNLVKGELTLVAKNLIDGSLYYSVTIPLKGSATGGEGKAMKSMIENIKSTDTQFSRFIRVARQQIQDHYAVNCATILQKAKGLYDVKKYAEAMSYLSAISETLPCYEQAAVLQAELAQFAPAAPDTVIIQKVIEKIVEKPVEVEKIVEVEKVVEVERIVEKIVERPVIVEKIVERPVVQNVPKVDCKITISTNKLQFKVLKCTGDATGQRITILAEITNVDTSRNAEEYMKFSSAITDGGAECHSVEIQNGSWIKMPPRVPIRREFYVTKVFDKFASFSYVELYIANTQVFIRNLPVKW